MAIRGDEEKITVVTNEVEFKEGSSRAAWWSRIQKFHGKDIEAFLAMKKPPTDEAPMGWLRFFTKQGLSKSVYRLTVGVRCRQVPGRIFGIPGNLLVPTNQLRFRVVDQLSARVLRRHT